MLELMFLSSPKSKITLMIRLEAPTSLVFIPKRNAGPSHSMGFYILTNFLVIFTISTNGDIKVFMLLPKITSSYD